jgi:ABC-2 type transport system permease protein
LLNGVSAAYPTALLLTLVVATLVCIPIGLIYGTLASNAKSLYTLMKTLNVLLAGPIVFYFTDWPRWIARLFPTYWFLDPLYRVTLLDAALPQVSGQLLKATSIAGVLTIAVLPLGRRLTHKVAGS